MTTPGVESARIDDIGEKPERGVTVSDSNSEGVTADSAASNSKVTTEEVNVSGEAVVGKVKELLREGNIRRIMIRNDEGKTLLEIPLTIGVVGALLVPQLAALGAVGALIANLNIRIEREHGDLATRADMNKTTPEEVM